MNHHTAEAEAAQQLTVARATPVPMKAPKSQWPREQGELIEVNQRNRLPLRRETVVLQV
jgi:hypothetical protein